MTNALLSRWAFAPRDADSVLDCARFLRITRKVHKDLRDFEADAAERAAVEAAEEATAAVREEKEMYERERQAKPKLKSKQKKLPIHLDDASKKVQAVVGSARDLIAMSKPGSRSFRSTSKDKKLPRPRVV